MFASQHSIHSPPPELHELNKANAGQFWQWHPAEGIFPKERATKGRASSEVYTTTESSPFNTKRKAKNKNKKVMH